MNKKLPFDITVSLMIEKYEPWIRWAFYLLPVFASASTNIFFPDYRVLGIALFPFVLAWFASFFVIPVYFIYLVCMKDWSEAARLIVACFLNVLALYPAVT